MSAVPRPPCGCVGGVSVTLPGRSSDTRLEFGIPVIRENTVDRLCLESDNHGHKAGSGLGTQSDTAEVGSSPTPVDALYYADHISQRSNEDTERSANHAQVANEPYRGELPPYITEFIRRSRNKDKSLCSSGLQYCAPPQINTANNMAAPASDEKTTPGKADLAAHLSAEIKAPQRADLVTSPSAETNSPGKADLAAPPSAETKAPTTADLAAPPSAETKTPRTADLAAPPSAETKARSTVELAAPPSAETKAPGSAALAAPPSAETKTPRTADLAAAPSAETKTPRTADLAAAPSAETKAPRTAALAASPSAESKAPRTADLVTSPSAETKALQTVKRQCDVSCSTEVEVKPWETYAFRSARNNTRAQPTKNRQKHVERIADRTDFRRYNRTQR